MTPTGRDKELQQVGIKDPPTQQPEIKGPQQAGPEQQIRQVTFTFNNCCKIFPVISKGCPFP